MHKGTGFGFVAFVIECRSGERRSRGNWRRRLAPRSLLDIAEFLPGNSGDRAPLLQKNTAGGLHPDRTAETAVSMKKVGRDRLPALPAAKTLQAGRARRKNGGRQASAAA